MNVFLNGIFAEKEKVSEEEIKEIESFFRAKGFSFYVRPDRSPDAVVDGYELYIKEGMAFTFYKWNNIYQPYKMFFNKKRNQVGLRGIKRYTKPTTTTDYKPKKWTDAYKGAVAESAILAEQDILPENFGKIPPMR